MAPQPLTYPSLGVQFQLIGTKSKSALQMNDVATNSGSSFTAVATSPASPSPGTWLTIFTDDTNVRQGHGLARATDHMQMILGPGLVSFGFPEYGPSLARLFDFVPDTTVRSGQVPFFIVTQYAPKQALQISKASNGAYIVTAVPWTAPNKNIETYQFMWQPPTFSSVQYTPRYTDATIVDGTPAVTKVVNFDTPPTQDYYILGWDVVGSWIWTFDGLPNAFVPITEGPCWNENDPKEPGGIGLNVSGITLGQTIPWSIPTEESWPITSTTQQLVLRSTPYTATVPCTAHCSGGGPTGSTSFPGRCIVKSWYKQDATVSSTKSTPVPGSAS